MSAANLLLNVPNWVWWLIGVVAAIALITVIVIFIIIDVNKRKYGDDFGRGGKNAETTEKRQKESESAVSGEKNRKVTKPAKVNEEKADKKQTKPAEANPEPKKVKEEKTAPAKKAEKAEKPAEKMQAKEVKTAETKTETKTVKETKPAGKKSEPNPAQKGGKVYHISKRKEDGMWQIKAAGGEKAIKLFKTQKEAIDYCKTLAANQDANIMIHKEDGSFRKLTY